MRHGLMAVVMVDRNWGIGKNLFSIYLRADE